MKCTNLFFGDIIIRVDSRGIVPIFGADLFQKNIELMSTKTLTQTEQEQLIQILKQRFSNNKHRHPNLDWTKVEERLSYFPDKMETLSWMNETGGEPDVIAVDAASGAVCFCDCSIESPAGRRALCYDAKAWEARKQNKPQGAAQEMAHRMGVSLLTEEEYLRLQSLGAIDTKTSSWLQTPPEMRQLGGALFADFRYGRVFFYHNGADSYYSSRGFRGLVWV